MCMTKFNRKQTVRHQPAHKCSCCKKVGHNIKQCPNPAAKELIHLRAAVKGFLDGAPQKRFKGRLPVKKTAKSGHYRKEAKKAYGTVKNTGGRRTPHHLASSSVVDAHSAQVATALDELLSFGFIRGFEKGCFACGAALGEAEPFKASGKLYFRCTSWKCQKRHNVTDFSLFRGTRLSLFDLCRVITFYSRSRLMEAPRVADAQSQLKLARCAVEHIYEALQAAEARRGEQLCRTQNATRRLVGDIEADAHGLRKLYVGQNNPHFQTEVAAAATRFQKAKPFKPVPKYWQAHFRVLGLKARSYMGPVAKRGGNIVLKVLPFKLVPPGASPPVESKSEIVQSKIMTFLGDSKKIRLYSDGAKAWESLCKEKRIKNFPVTHRKQQFTRKLKTWKKPGATIAGTQAVDRWWQSLDRFIPSSLNNKDWSKGGLNQKLILYMHAFVWRYHLPVTADLKSHLGKLK